MNLAQSDQLKHGIVHYLVQTVFSFTDELRTTTKNPEEHFLEPHILENMYYILSCLEELLQKEISSRSLVTLITPDIALQIQTYLDDAVLHISEKYPMFVYYIWHISDLIRRLDQPS